MSTIDITRAHTLPLDAAKLKAEELAKSMETKLGMTWKWAGNTIRFETPSGAAKGTKGDVQVTRAPVIGENPDHDPPAVTCHWCQS